MVNSLPSSLLPQHIPMSLQTNKQILSSGKCWDCAYHYLPPLKWVWFVDTTHWRYQGPAHYMCAYVCVCFLVGVATWLYCDHNIEPAWNVKTFGSVLMSLATNILCTVQEGPLCTQLYCWLSTAGRGAMDCVCTNTHNWPKGHCAKTHNYTADSALLGAICVYILYCWLKKINST